MISSCSSIISNKKPCIQLESPPTLSIENALLMINSIFAEKESAVKERMALTIQQRLNGSFEHPSTEEFGGIRLRKKIDGLSLWCTKRTHGIHITFLEHILNKGSYKKVKAATSFLIPKESENSLSYTNQVISRVKQEDIETVLKGVEIHQQIYYFNETYSRNYFAPPPHLYPIFQRSEKGKTLEIESARYLDCFLHIIDDFPLKIADGFRFLTPLEIVKGLKNIALGVEHLMSMGVSHQDIKPDNILVNIENGKPVFHIFDFDCAVNQLPQYPCEERSSYYLNYAAREGVATQETDCYSLIFLIIEALIPNLRVFVREETDNTEVLLDKYRMLSSHDISISELNQQKLRDHQIRTLKERLPQEHHPLLEPFLDHKQSELTEATRALLQYTDSLNQHEGSEILISVAIRRFIIGLTLSEDLFGMLKKILETDLAIENSLDDSDIESESHSTVDDQEEEKEEDSQSINSAKDEESIGFIDPKTSESEDSFLDVMVNAMRDHPFPTITEIKQLLNHCEAVITDLI